MASVSLRGLEDSSIFSSHREEKKSRVCYRTFRSGQRGHLSQAIITTDYLWKRSTVH